MPSLEEVRRVVHRLFIAREGTTLRREDEQKSRELAALLPRLSRLKHGAHLVDAAAGKSSVGLVAAELLPAIGALTVLERDRKRIAACRDAEGRLARALPVELREADVADLGAWPHGADAVVALHACGPAADAVIDGAIESGARCLFLVPCCYGNTIPFAARAEAIVGAMDFVGKGLVRRRLRASLIDLERELRLEAAGYETGLDEFVGATVTPHNVLFTARRTRDPGRIERAKARLRALAGA